MEGTASARLIDCDVQLAPLPEDRPVGGYCKRDRSVDGGHRLELPEDRPVGGYCKKVVTKEVPSATSQVARG